MKNVLFAAAMALFGGAAFAGGLAPANEVVVEVPVVHEMSWTGPYVGLSYERLGEAVSGAEGDAYNAIVGYRHQFDNRFVVGGEAGFGTLTAGNDEGTLQSVEFQVGLAMGNWLPYASIGQTTAYRESDNAIVVQNYGVGVDYAVSDNFFVGATYTKYDVESLDIDSWGVRAGWMF